MDVAEVLLLLPVVRTYSYHIPEEIRASIKAGAQVRCAVNNRMCDGVVVKVHALRPPGIELSSIGQVIVQRPPWPPDLIELVRWMSEYYVAAIGLVARTAMPTLFARRRPQTVQALAYVGPPEKPFRSDVLVQMLGYIKESGPVPLEVLRRHFSGSSPRIRRLLETGCVRYVDWKEPEEPPVTVSRPATLMLTEAQQSALEAIAAQMDRGYSAWLLHGVTGSGKTEVYLRLIEQVLRQNKGAIVLVPEIALTFALRQRFEERFGKVVAVLHSGMSDARRAKAWDDILAKKVRLVVGARSAVFAPVQNLGLIVVDEEHETSYKQQDGLRYNARDCCLVRGKIARCPVVLGSATPSLESFQNAHDKKYHYLSLPKRVEERPMPSVRFIDLRYQGEVGNERLLSNPLVQALQDTIARGESAILFLNRRGYARFVLCKACGKSIGCPNCSISLTFHEQRRRLRCHYCDYEIPMPHRCPSCNFDDCRLVGFGTERILQEVQEQVPQARPVRLDADSALATEAILQDFAQQKTNVLVGTQIVVKGHDFHHVTLVGVLLAEQSLSFPDFRAAERTFQLLTQVAGRAGRGDRPGEVLIQTYSPDQYALRFAASHDWLGFATTESLLRRQRQYPPFVHLATLEVSSTDAIDAQQTAQQIAAFMKNHLTPDLRLLGPSLASLQRLKGRTRVQLLLKATQRRTLNTILWKTRKTFGRGREPLRIHIDVDPFQMS